jgi:hypothetical protein
MKRLVLYSFVMLVTSLLTSCTATRNSMQEGNYSLQFQRNDFEFSDPVSGKAKEVKVLGVDWQRLFNRKETVLKGNGQTVDNTNKTAQYLPLLPPYFYRPLDVIASLAVISVIGNTAKSHAEELALHDLVQKNPNYDVVMFPKYDKKTVWWILGRTTTVTAKARLGVLKK